MKNIDVEIYISQMITFFEKKPKDFIELFCNIEKATSAVPPISECKICNIFFFNTKT